MQGPRRISVAGPMAPSSFDSSRKSSGLTNITYVKSEIKRENSNVLAKAHKDISTDAIPHLDGAVNFISIIDTPKNILCCKYTEDFSHIAAGCTDGLIRIYDSHSGICTNTLMDDEEMTDLTPVTALKHRPIRETHPVMDTIISTHVSGLVKAWKYKYNKCVYTIRENRQTLGLSYHHCLPKFVTCGDDGKLNMYNEEAQTQERSFYKSNNNSQSIDGHTSRVFTSMFHPKSNHELISGGWDNCVICWDERQPHAARHFFGCHICGEGLDFNSTGNEILTCSWQEKDAIQIWDYGSCKLIKSITPDPYISKLYCGKYVKGTNFMICGGSDRNTLRLVDIKLEFTECGIRQSPHGIYGFDVAPAAAASGARRDKAKARQNKSHRTEVALPNVAFVCGKRLIQLDFQ